jgi:hypothetical protein
MTIYWIDTSVLTQANRGSYAFDLLPSFWIWLEEQIKAGVVRSPTLVQEEIARGNDDLVEWAVRMESHGLFVVPDPKVIAEFTPIADHVHSQCDRAEGDGFLDDADPWVIAHAKATGGIAVTEEVAVGSESKKVRIPNVCARFGVGHMNTLEFLRQLKFRR